MTIDLTKRMRDWAVYLPALNSNLLETSSGHKYPSGKPEPYQYFDFYDSTDGVFYYPYGLYSSGLTVTRSASDNLKAARRSSLYNRDPKVKILTDSGGFQIATQDPLGSFVNFGNWQDVRKMRRRIYEWQMATGDMGIIIDIPLFCQRRAAQLWFPDFQHCLDMTVENIEFLFSEYPDRTHPFLNVVQATNEQEIYDWYNAVRKFELQGWAFGGTLQSNYYLMLKLCILLRDNHELQQGQRDWIHMFGKGRTTDNLHYTQIKRCLRQTTNPDLEITHDTAAYSIMAGRVGLIYAATETQGIGQSHELRAPKRPTKPNPKRTLQTFPSDEEILMGEKGEWFDHARSPLLDGKDYTDLITTSTNSGWDDHAVATVMLHNLYIALDTMFWANIQYDRAVKTGRPAKFGDIHKMNTIIKEVFDSPDPQNVLANERPFLENY